MLECRASNSKHTQPACQRATDSCCSRAAPAVACLRERASPLQRGGSRSSSGLHFVTNYGRDLRAIAIELRHQSSYHLGRLQGLGFESASTSASVGRLKVRAESAAPEKPKTRYPGEAKGFVEEMRFVAMKLHTKDQSKEGEKQADVQPVAKWEPSIDGYLKFLVNSKVVYDTMETVVAKASHPSYAEFRNTGLERSERLAKDLAWFQSQGHRIPEPGNAGTSYAELLTELSEKDVPAFICHFYNVYFAHSAGGRFIGKKVAEMILDGRELEFYKWDKELPELLAAVKATLNKVAEGWTREEKNHCLEETELSFKFSGKILRLIISQ